MPDPIDPKPAFNSLQSPTKRNGVDTTDVKRLAFVAITIGTLMNLTSRGLTETFAVFLLPLSEAFNADRAAITAIYSSYMLVYGLATPVSGLLVDKLGVRLCYGFGLLILAFSFWMAASASSLGQLYFYLGVLPGIGTAAMGMVCASELAVLWFDKRLPSAMSVLYAALGIGVLIFAPLSQWLINSEDWRFAYRVLAIIPLLFMPLLLLPQWPALLRGNPNSRNRTKASANDGIRSALLQALRNNDFWKLFFVMFFTSFTTLVVLVQLVAFLIEQGFSALFAASVFGLVGILSTAGMILSGMLAERFGETRVATLSYASTITGVACLAVLNWYPSFVFVAAFVILFGSVSGSRGPLVAVLSSRIFGGKGQATIYGTVLLAMGLGGALAAWAGGALHDLTGDYQAGFALSATSAVAGLLSFRSIRIPSHV